MEQILGAISLLGILIFAGPAFAMPVDVDFSSLGANSADITIPDSCVLDGVTFHYDNFGIATDTFGNPAVVQVDGGSVWGSTYGCLTPDFNTPATALTFDFALLGASQSVDDALVVTFSNSGNSVTDTVVPTAFAPYDPNNPGLGGDSLGTLTYKSAQFDQALIFFSIDAPYFGASNMTYEPVSTTAPEPGSLLALVAGFLSASGLWKIKRKAQ